MPDISIVRLLTEPVVIEIGEGTVTFNAQPAKVSAKDKNYPKLVRRDIELRDEANTLGGQLKAIINEVSQPRSADSKATTEEAEKEIEQKAEEISKKIDAVNEKLVENYAKRIVYLSPTWDITDNGEMWPMTVENLTSIFPALMLEVIVSEIEKKVFRRSRPLHPAMS